MVQYKDFPFPFCGVIIHPMGKSRHAGLPSVRTEEKKDIFTWEISKLYQLMFAETRHLVGIDPLSDDVMQRVNIFLRVKTCF